MIRLPTVALGILIVSAASVPLRGTASQAGAGRALLASVTDGRNRPLTDLGEDDFVVREGGTPREVFAVRLADYPIVVVVDDSSGAAADFEAVRGAAVRFIARIGRDRPVALAGASRPDTTLTTFDDDRAGVNAALAALQPAPSGEPKFLAAVGAAAEMIRATQAPFSAVVVISATSPDVPVDAGVDLLAPIVDSRAMVHVIAKTPAGEAGGAEGTAGAALRAVSAQTRGQYTAIYTAASYAPALDRLADRLSAEMMIEYIEPPGAEPNDDVEVGVRVPGAQVRGLGVSR